MPVLLPLPVLTVDESLLLARSCLEVKGLEPEEIRTTLNDAIFRIALGDTGGLPGLVFFLSTGKPPHLSYVEHLHNQTNTYITGNWNHRWKAITSVCFARPHVTNTTVLMTEYKHPTSTSAFYRTRDDFLAIYPSLNPDMAAIAYTVRDALDGGTDNGGEGMFNPIPSLEKYRWHKNGHGSILSWPICSTLPLSWPLL